MKKMHLTLMLVLFTSVVLMAGEWNSGSHREKAPSYLWTTALAALIPVSQMNQETELDRAEQVKRTGQWVGLLAGAGISTLHLYWMTQDRGTGWKVWATGIPPILISSYVGMVTTRWASEQIMKERPKPGKALLKGALFGAIDGSIILAASYLPLFVVGHYLGIIHFNNIEGNFMLFKIIGITLVGSMAYGGSVGAIAGGISGPVISLYMKF